MAYSYSQEITISASLCGSSNSTNFPLLFGGKAGPYAALATVINGGNILHTVSFNGQTVPADLIFTSDSAGTSLLSWEVASYNASTGDIEVWIQIPTLSSMTNTVIYMFAGNASVSTYQGGSVGAAWDSYMQLVYHMANGSTLSLNDSTANANTASNFGPVTATPGQIDGAGNFSGSECWLNAGSNPTNLQISTGTVSAWVETTTNDAIYRAIIVKQNAYGMFVTLGYAVVYDWSSASTINSGVLVDDGNWHHVAVVFNSGVPGTTKIYVDGVLGNYGEVTVASQSYTPQIGYGNYNGQYWNGGLDEARIANTIRSADWITAEYNNQSSPSTFYTLSNIPSSTSLSLLTLLGAGT